MKKSVLILVMALLAVAAACRAKKSVSVDPGEKGSDKKMYENAVKYMTKDPEKARLLFKEVGQLYPDSIYASKSKLGIGDAYFKERDSASLVMAAAEYQEYVNLYPYSPDAVYAKFQIGMCYFKQVRKPERDQTNTFAAIKGFEGVIQQYPGTPEADQAKKKIDECRQILARHYFQIGYYNFLMKSFEGAIVRFKQVMDDYPDFKHNDRLLYYTGRTYAAMGDRESALSFFQRLVGGSAKSKYVAKAKRQIEKLGRQAAKDKKTPAPPRNDGAAPPREDAAAGAGKE